MKFKITLVMLLILCYSAYALERGTLDIEEISIKGKYGALITITVYVANIGNDVKENVSIGVSDCPLGWDCGSFVVSIPPGESESGSFEMSAAAPGALELSTIDIIAQSADASKVVSVDVLSWCVESGYCEVNDGNVSYTFAPIAASEESGEGGGSGEGVAGLDREYRIKGDVPENLKERGDDGNESASDNVAEKAEDESDVKTEEIPIRWVSGIFIIGILMYFGFRFFWLSSRTVKKKTSRK